MVNERPKFKISLNFLKIFLLKPDPETGPELTFTYYI